MLDVPAVETAGYKIVDGVCAYVLTDVIYTEGGIFKTIANDIRINNIYHLFRTLHQPLLCDVQKR